MMTPFLIDVPVVLKLNISAETHAQALEIARQQVNAHFVAALTGDAPTLPLGLVHIAHQKALEPMKVVVHLGTDGDSPAISSTGAISVAIVRSGDDLEDYDEEDIFSVRKYTSHKGQEQVVGHIDYLEPHLDETLYVSKIFEAIEKHEAKSASREQNAATPGQK